MSSELLSPGSTQSRPSSSSPSLTSSSSSTKFYLTADGILIDPDNSTNSNSSDVIHSIIRDKNWSLLRHLFRMPFWKQHCSKMLSQQDRDGRTPLHVFCRMTDQFLLEDVFSNTNDIMKTSSEGNENEDESNNIINNNGENSKESLPMDIAKGLMNARSIYIKDKGDENILHGLCGRGDSSHVQLVKEILNFADSSHYEEGGARRLLSDTNEYGLTPLHFVCDGNTPIETVRIMLQYCSSIPRRNKTLKAAPVAKDSSQNVEADACCYEEQQKDSDSSTPQVQSKSVPMIKSAMTPSLSSIASRCKDCTKAIAQTDPEPPKFRFTATWMDPSMVGESFVTNNHFSISNGPKVEPELDDGPHALSLQDFDGDTCLHFACSGGGDVKLLKELCSHYPEATLIENKERQLPVQDLFDYWKDEVRDISEIITKQFRVVRDMQVLSHEEQRKGDITSSTRNTSEDNKDNNSTNKSDDDDEKALSKLWDSVSILLQMAYKAKYSIEEVSSELASDSVIEQREAQVPAYHAAIAIKEFPLNVFMLASIKCQIQKEVRTFHPISGMLPLHVATSIRMPMTSSRNSKLREQLLSTFQKIKLLLQWYPEAASMYSRGKNQKQQQEKVGTSNIGSFTFFSGRRGQHLPLMLAVTNNHPIGHLKILLKYAPQTIRCQDEGSVRSGSSSATATTKDFYPFMMAAVGNNNSLSVVYELLLHDPTVLLTFFFI